MRFMNWTPGSCRSQEMGTPSEFPLHHSMQRKKLPKSEPRGVAQGPPFPLEPEEHYLPPPLGPQENVGLTLPNCSHLDPYLETPFHTPPHSHLAAMVAPARWPSGNLAGLQLGGQMLGAAMPGLKAEWKVGWVDV